MQTVILIFLFALAVTGFSTPWVRKMALALGFVDAPADRKLHTRARSRYWVALPFLAVRLLR